MRIKDTSPPVDYESISPVTPEIRRRVNRADPNDTVSPGISVANAPFGVEIEHVESGSAADRAGVRTGWKLNRINARGIRDTIDFYFHAADETLHLDLEDAEGKSRNITIHKDSPEQSLGLGLKQFTTQNCGCNCVFCFVHQLPDNMRKSLYIKDEDYRLSFMQGSYITGATLKQEDLDRIAGQRLSPLYLSVHAVDETLRRWLLGIRKATPILDVLAFFRDHRIQIHTQIVLCPTHNDGEQLSHTLDALIELHPTVQSVAIVPLGMTRWRDGLPPLPPVTPEYARAFIRRARPLLRDVEQRFGEPFVLLADEWYLIAGRKVPSYSKYPDMPQLENGVGMVYHFYRDLAAAKRTLRDNPCGKSWRVGAVTSTLSVPVLEKIISACREAGIEVVPLPTVNTVFGESVHVTGLLTGEDITTTIRENSGFDQYLLPGNCLRHQDEKFLDDLTLEQLRAKTGERIDVVLGGALDFVETVLEAACGYQHDASIPHPLAAPAHWANS